MDIKEQVAARRLELERQRRAAQEKLRRDQAEQHAAAKAQHEKALHELAAELSTEAGVEINCKGGRLAFARPNPLPSLDPSSFRQAELKRMLWKEARTEFTEFENFLVIAALSAGVTFSSQMLTMPRSAPLSSASLLLPQRSFWIGTRSGSSRTSRGYSAHRLGRRFIKRKGRSPMRRPAFPAAALLLLVGCSKFSTAEIEAYKGQCVDMYKTDFHPVGNDVKALDTWTKEGKLVVQVGEEQGLSDSYSIRLCVIDKKGGMVEIPSAFDQNRWDK